MLVNYLSLVSGRNPWTPARLPRPVRSWSGQRRPANVPWRRFLCAGMTLLLSAALDSFGTSRVLAPTDPRLTADSTRADRGKVVGYTTTDGRYHSFHAYLTVNGDSLVLTQPAKPALTASPQRVIVIARGEVLSLTLDEGISTPRTFWLCVIPLLAVIAAVSFASAW